MKLLILVITFLCCSAFAEQNNTKQGAYKEAQELFELMRDLEFHKVIDRIPPHVISTMAKRTRMSEDDLLTKFKSSLPNGRTEEHNGRYIKVSSTPPSQMVFTSDEYFTVVKYISSTKSIEGSDLIEDGFVLGWKKSTSKKWYFMSGKGLNHTAIKIYFPNYNGELLIPAYRKCVDEC